METIMMRTLGMLAAMVAATAGCTNLDRSRDTGNPQVSAATLAQQVCSNCHGVTGVSVSPNFPHLAAQRPSYFVAQMKGFRSKERQDPAGYEYMWGLSRSLTDAQIEGLAGYYAAQPPAPGAAAGASPRLAAGRAIFEGGLPEKNVPACAGCHGNAGQGNADFPRLAGQHADYLDKQLSVFQRGNERPQGGVMQVVAHNLSREDIRNVTAFLQTLTH
jgi:cytochrome c553